MLRCDRDLPLPQGLVRSQSPRPQIAAAHGKPLLATSDAHRLAGVRRALHQHPAAAPADDRGRPAHLARRSTPPNESGARAGAICSTSSISSSSSIRSANVSGSAGRIAAQREAGLVSRALIMSELRIDFSTMKTRILQLPGPAALRLPSPPARRPIRRKIPRNQPTPPSIRRARKMRMSISRRSSAGCAKRSRRTT